jgi:phosphatidylglycerol:prolipoprotein diacylglycerol transferase
MHPVLLTLFGLPLYSYGLMLFISMSVGRALTLRLAERVGIDRRFADRCILWTLVFAIVGSRLLFVITNPDQLDRAIDVVEVWRGGIVAYGGFLGGFAAAYVMCRRNGVRLLAWADCAAPGLCIGLAITRVGCFLAGCDFGQPWQGPWAMSFPAGSPAFIQQGLAGLLPAGATQSLPVHPTQLYESLVGFALLALVIAVTRRRRAWGQPFAALVVGYAVLRFFIETVRADAGRGFIGPLSTSQLIAIGTSIAAIALLWTLRRSADSLEPATLPVRSNRRPRASRRTAA